MAKLRSQEHQLGDVDKLLNLSECPLGDGDAIHT